MKEKYKWLNFWQEDCDVERFVEWERNGKHWKKTAREYIKKRKYKNVLDVGAGTYLEYYGFRDDDIVIDYKATEITNTFLEIAKYNNIDAVKAHAQSLPFDDNSFDIVLCYDVLNHQEDFKEIILELYRVCKHEVLISFFKPFIEDPRGSAIEEIESGKFKVEPASKTNGVILHRMTNSLGETTAIYHFFSIIEMTSFLENNFSPFQYSFHEVDEKQILKILK